MQNADLNLRGNNQKDENQLTTGASGGAILNPCEIIPAKFVRREPCHNSCLLGKSLKARYRFFSPCLSKANTLSLIHI